MISYRAITIWMVVLAGGAMAVSAECDLQCDNETSTACVEGKADFKAHRLPDGSYLPFHKDADVSEGGYHCNCTEGWTGLKCKRRFDSCDRPGNICYHDGACIEGLEDVYGNEQLFCDCKKAIGPSGKYHVGQFCHHPVNACPADEKPSDRFCLNGGECDDKNDCVCDPEFTGKHCEFVVSRGNYNATCSLDCGDNGTCKKGLKNIRHAMLMFHQYSFYDETDYEHCRCNEGFSGGLCEKDNREKTCGEGGQCQNGGVCEQLFDKDGVSVAKEACNCNPANTADVSYAGEFCQHISTSFCSKEADENGHTFCVNGGICNATGTHFGCDCPAGFTGPICEINLAQSGVITPENNCSLKCDNGGNCRSGFKDVSILSQYGEDLAGLNASHENFEHCVCPTGFVGPKCETKVEFCIDGKHLCLHGSKCIKVGDKQACDCDSASTAFDKYAGDYCQHQSTSHCTIDGRPSVGGKADAFCVNNGECVAVVNSNEEHEGCECPDEYTGDHCEIISASRSQSPSGNDGSNGSKNEGAAIFFSLAVVAVVGTLIIAVVVWRKRVKSKADNAADFSNGVVPPRSNGSHKAGPVLDMSMDKGDGSDIEDVEII